jgi:hypothetical protein
MTGPDTIKLLKQLTRIADAMEESNKLKLKEIVIERKRFNRDYQDVSETVTPTIESPDSES